MAFTHGATATRWGLFVLIAAFVGCSDSGTSAMTSATPALNATATDSATATATATSAPSSNSGAISPAATIESALAALTVEELPGLMLSRNQVQAAGLFVDRSDRSGFTSNVEIAESFPALGLTAADVESWGRVAGHRVVFEPFPVVPDGAPAATEVGIELFKSPAGAAAYVAARRTELSQSDQTITIVRAEPFEVGKDGGEGLSVVATHVGYEREISEAVAWVQRGRVVSWASVIDFGRFDRALTAERTAIVQAEYLENVLTGVRQPNDLLAEPRFPDLSQLIERPRTPGEPDLAQLTIAAEALPRPFSPTWSGYIVNSSIEHAYIRDFADRPFVKFTTLEVSRIRVQTTWLPDGEDYAIYIDGLRSRPIEVLTTDMEAASGLRDLEIEVEQPGYGETATLIIGRGSGPDGMYGYGAMWIDGGEFAVRLVVVGPSGIVTPDDIRAIAGAVAGQFEPPPS